MNKAGSSKPTDEDKEMAKKPECREAKDNVDEVSSSSSSSLSSPSVSDDEDGKADDRLSSIQKFFAEKLHLLPDKESDHVLETVDLDGVIKHWKNKGFNKIVTMVGAGISTCKYHFPV